VTGFGQLQKLQTPLPEPFIKVRNKLHRAWGEQAVFHWGGCGGGHSSWKGRSTISPANGFVNEGDVRSLHFYLNGNAPNKGRAHFLPIRPSAVSEWKTSSFPVHLL
jgi:hypothetical protein